MDTFRGALILRHTLPFDVVCMGSLDNIVIYKKVNSIYAKTITRLETAVDR